MFSTSVFEQQRSSVRLRTNQINLKTIECCLQKHARGRTQQEFHEPDRYGAPLGWITPEIPPGYFNSTCRFEDTPQSSEARTGSSIQQTPISGNASFAAAGLQQGQQYHQQQMFSFPSACKKPRTRRLPPVAPSTSIIRAAKAVATGRPGQEDRRPLFSQKVKPLLRL